MSFKSAVGKFIAESIVKAALGEAGKHIGEAIGKRVGAKIYTPPVADDEKTEKSGSGEDESQ